MAAAKHPQLVKEPFDGFFAENGFEATYALVEHFGGKTIYVPGARAMFQECILAEARKEFDGGNYAEIARKFGYSERSLRRLL